MMDTEAGIAQRVAELRRDFDRSFASPPAEVSTAWQDLLAIKLGDKPYAVRLSEVASLHADKVITRVPGSNAALLGIAGFRGAIMPVYDLQRLLGHAVSAVPRWLVVAAAAPIAFAFEGFDGQLRVLPDAITARQAAAQDYTKDFVQSGALLRPIIQLTMVLGAIKN